MVITTSICNQGHLGSNRLICMHLDTTMGYYAQLKSSGLFFMNVGATMTSRHLGSNRLIYRHLDIFS